MELFLSSVERLIISIWTSDEWDKMSSGAAILGVFDQIKGRLHISNKKILIENFVFRLFSKFTVAALFLCAGLVTLQQLVGNDFTNLRKYSTWLIN